MNTPTRTNRQVACVPCGAANRVPADRLGDDPVCGRCGQPLLAGRPVDLTDADFDRVAGRTELPVLALECEVKRRQSRRTHYVYWNPLLKDIEPLSCAKCGANMFAVAFTDKEVSPGCSACAD